MGNYNKRNTVHSSRTMMFLELSKVMDFSVDLDNYRDTMCNNFFGKKSQDGIKKTSHYLNKLYGFDIVNPKFKAFKEFWLESALLSAALKFKEKLEAILNGEAPYDIFVRWKTIKEQPIGWDPDLNDGVRLNIRPFVEAGILRNKFNVKWGVDRGKNPPGSSWGEIRDKDKHLTLTEKREAREK